MNWKSPLDSQKNKWQTATTKCSTEYKVSKALITNLDTKHWTYQPSRRTNFKSLNERKFKQRKLKGLKTSKRCDMQDFRLTESCQQQKTPKQAKNQTRQGQANPTQILCWYRIYATLYAGNLHTIRDYLIEQPMYTRCYTRLCITKTHVYKKKFKKDSMHTTV